MVWEDNIEVGELKEDFYHGMLYKKEFHERHGWIVLDVIHHVGMPVHVYDSCVFKMTDGREMDGDMPVDEKFDLEKVKNRMPNILLGNVV